MKNQDLEYFRKVLTQRLDDLLKKGDEETFLLNPKQAQFTIPLTLAKGE